MGERGFSFRAPDRPSLWRKLALTMRQASSLTGVSERQIQHWMDRGYIYPVEPGTRKINGECVDTILLIRQAREEGIPLRHAVALARQYLGAERATAWDSAVPATILCDLHEKLRNARTGIEAVERLMHDVEQGKGDSRRG